MRDEDISRQYSPIGIMRAQVLGADVQVGEQEYAEGHAKNGQ